MKSRTYRGVGFCYWLKGVGKWCGKTPPVGVAKKSGGGYIIEKFGVQE
jgi:hypothetical protein